MTAMEQVRAACEKAGCVGALDSIIAMYEIQLDILRDDLLEARRVHEDIAWRLVNHFPDEKQDAPGKRRTPPTPRGRERR